MEEGKLFVLHLIVGYQREQDAMRIGGEEKADSVIAVEDEE